MAPLYPANLETKIGFDNVRQLLIDRCQSCMGIKEVEAMTFNTDFQLVREQLLQTFEMKQMSECGEDLPDVSYNTLHHWLTSLKVEGTYGSPDELHKLRNSLLSFGRVRDYYTRRSGKDETSPLLYPKLAKLFGNLSTFPDLIKEINRVIDNTGSVKESASPELADIRSRLVSMHGNVARVLQRIFFKAVQDGITDKDSSPTLRDGRMVIPVFAGNKRSLKGIVHDESASGKTIFIEPAETVELSNRIRELEIEEQRIIVRILTLLTDKIRPWIDEILSNNLILGKLDFIMAKARLAIEIGGNLPVLARHPEIDWYGAVHPVLLLNLNTQNKEIVPLNIRLNGKKRILVISGPNAGGKSVALKTVGIIQYMTQCGMLPTMYSNSHLGIFNKIFIDIGDEQSIENDLSTYSSHLKNMRYFMLHSNDKTLILIDEIGSGTEPNIGSSLAKAILDELARSRCFGVVTTHYHNLKRFAEENESFINGAMLYDRQKLQPTFQLSIGTAGSSFALEIASKIGLPKNVIESAKKEVGVDYVESDKYLMEIARDRKYWQLKRTSIKERESRLEELEDKYGKLVAELNQKRKDIIREAQEEAKHLLAGTNRRIENTIAEIRHIEAEKSRTKAIRKELEEFKQELEVADVKGLSLHTSPALHNRKKKEKKSIKTTPGIGHQSMNKPDHKLEVGAYVKMSGSNAVGRIISLTSKEAEVIFGQLRTKVKLTKLEAASNPPAPQISSSGYNLINGDGSEGSRIRQLNFKDEIDIRGMRADEALDILTRFLDDAIQFGVKKVRILHGTGAGILRQLVRQKLSVTPGIAKYEDEDVRMGGTGITVISLL